MPMRSIINVAAMCAMLFVAVLAAMGQSATFAVNNVLSMGDITQFQANSINMVRIDSSGNIIVTGVTGGGNGTFNGTITSGLNAGTGGSLTLNGSSTGSAAITVSSAGVLALPSGTTATSMVLTTPSLGTPASGTLTNATGLPLGSGVTATFSSPLSLSGNTLSCPSCVTGSSLTSTAIMTGAGSQGSQTPSSSATLSGSGSMSLPGTISSEGTLSTGTTFAASGCSNSTTQGGATAGSYVIGATSASCTVTITMGNLVAAAHGWACSVWDVTTTADVQKETGYTTTTVALTGPASMGDVIAFACQGF